ncbi:uncharacterized protein J4E92_001453 [Alternaria infectoria]|uniref:uncharacterized protein n=1 Tax=Alternaria infectoria TaxID=45303 RepID=UPI0022206C35|nr:uncharacterized protein J4E92_001453 [Alternaria infectoria]KAI4936729.1 hypothetical protein J4E92_001453 [Alternaria infectoria]
MSAVSEKGPTELGADPLNFIYACSVCCASFADVYEGHNETVRGLSDGDSEPRDLFSIRGFKKDEYDPNIPLAWFTAPPIRLDGSGKEMEALRFQYIALIRYCQNTYATRKPLQEALTNMEKKLASVQDLASKEHAKVVTLQQENERLRLQKDQFQAMKAEVQRLQGLDEEVAHFRDVNPKDLATFLANKSAIRHYLKLVPMLVE